VRFCERLVRAGIETALLAVPTRYSNIDSWPASAAAIETALLAVPTRYTHSPFEMIHEDDLAAAVDLLHALVVAHRS